MKDVTTQKYDYIDALRGFAILGVILIHSAHQWVTPTGYLIEIAYQGARGVQLFYIASALTLFYSMASRWESENRPVLGFFIRRFFRIAPPFYLAIIVYSLYQGLAPRYWAPNGIEWWYIILTALFLHGWHPETISSVVPGGWSIAVEMTFYLLVPFLFLKLNNIKKTLVALFLSLVLSKILSSAVVLFLSPRYSAQQQYLVSSFTLLWFFSQIPVFLLGILLYHLIRRYPQADRKVAILLLLISCFFFLVFVEPQPFDDVLPQHFLYGIAFVLFALSLYYHPHILLVNRCTIWIGRLSFSIYLVHFMVLNYLEATIPDGFLRGNIGFALDFLLVVGISVCLSYITYKIVESPGISVGKYIIKKLQHSVRWKSEGTAVASEG